MTDRRARVRIALLRAVGAVARQMKAASATPLPDDDLNDIRARASPIRKGPEYASHYARDVPLLLDEVDRLRYELGVAKRAK